MQYFVDISAAVRSDLIGCIPGKQHADPKSQMASRGKVEVQAFDLEIIILFKKRPPWLMPIACI